MNPFIHGDWSGDDHPAPQIGGLEPNHPIDAELHFAPPAIDPTCPGCGQMMCLIPGEFWVCGNDDCQDRELYSWEHGTLVRVVDLS